MSRSSLTLDLKAHTGKALNEFKAFSDSLEKKFFISGLKVDLLQQTLGEINREFDKAMGSQGMASAMELKQLETSSAAVFSVLKGGSLEAGREMAKNIRVALGDVSKSIGSTTADINSVLRMVPYTSKAMLDSAGVSMEEFHTRNLRMITNARDAMGEDASKIIEGLLSGTTTQTDLLNDTTGIGQLIRTQVGAFDPSAMSPEARTEKVLQILQNQEFQTMLEGLADDNAGFMRIVRQFRNTLFDPRTGVFGILKESTLSLREFSGDRVTQVTSIFEETTRLFKVIFDPSTGMFARIFRTFGEVFGFNSQNFSDFLIRIIRWVTNALHDVSLFFSSADFKLFVGGLKGIIDFFVDGAQKISSLVGITPGGLGAAISNFVGGFGTVLKAVSEGDWTTAATTITSGISSTSQQVVRNFQEASQSSNSNINVGGAVVGGLIGTTLMPGIGTAAGAGIGGAINSQTVINITDGAKNIAVNIVEGAVNSVGEAVESAGGWEQIGEDTSKLITEIGGVIEDGVISVMDKIASDELDISGLLEGAGKILTALFTQGVGIFDSVLDGIIKLKDSLGEDAFKEIGESLAKMAISLLPVLSKAMGIIFDILSDVLTGFISEILTYINPVSWVFSMVSGVLRALGFEDMADKVDAIRDSINDFLGEVITKMLLILNPGGIITKILRFIPIIGGPAAKIFQGVQNIGKFVEDFGTSLLKNLGKVENLKTAAAEAKKYLDDLVASGAKIPGQIAKATARVDKLNKAVDDAIKNIPTLQKGVIKVFKVIEKIFGRIGNTKLFSAIGKFFTDIGTVTTSVLGKIPGVKNVLGGIISMFVKSFPEAIKGLFRSILSKVPIVGTAIDFAINKASGESNTRAMTKAVVSNIVGGALAALALPTGPLGMAAAAIVGSIGADWVTGKVLDMMGVKFNGNIPPFARASNGLNMLAAAAAREQENIRPGAKPVIANSDEIIIPPGRLSEVRFAITDQVGSTIESILNRQSNNGSPMTSGTISRIAMPVFDKDLEKIGETFEEYGEESEDTWKKSLDSASSFFRDLEYKSSVEWKRSINTPVQISTPSLSLDTSQIETSIKSGVEGINFGEIFSKIPEGLSSGWDNIVNFFEETGKRAKEILNRKDDNGKPWWQWGFGYNGNRLNTASMGFNLAAQEEVLNTASMGFNLAGFTAAAQEEVLNTGFSSNLVVANDTEIIAPRSSLNQLASLLLRQASVGRNGSGATIQNENNIVFNINGATDPDAVAAAVMEKMDTALSYTMMNNRVPHA